jgi:hypothetical protein
MPAGDTGGAAAAVRGDVGLFRDVLVIVGKRGLCAGCAAGPPRTVAQSGVGVAGNVSLVDVG